VPRLVLASRSPRRQALLQSAGLSFTVSPTHDVDESWHRGEAPIAYACRVARAKAEAGARGLEDAWVLAADTIVWFEPDQPPLGKPLDRADATAMLTRLAGRTHRVTTAWLLLDTDAHEVMHAAEETTRVWMRTLDHDQIERYLDVGEWQDKAGAYAVQGSAAGMVSRIEGSYTNVVGLPLAQVLETLEALTRGRA
jgi:septum formation protein